MAPRYGPVVRARLKRRLRGGHDRLVVRGRRVRCAAATSSRVLVRVGGGATTHAPAQPLVSPTFIGSADDRRVARGDGRARTARDHAKTDECQPGTTVGRRPHARATRQRARAAACILERSRDTPSRCVALRWSYRRAYPSSRKIISPFSVGRRPASSQARYRQMTTRRSPRRRSRLARRRGSRRPAEQSGRLWSRVRAGRAR